MRFNLLNAIRAHLTHDCFDGPRIRLLPNSRGGKEENCSWTAWLWPVLVVTFLSWSALAAAQGGRSPLVWFTHWQTGIVHSNAAVTDTVNWCDDGGLNSSSRSVTQNGSSLSTTYTGGTSSCGAAYAYSVMTFTPVLGNNTILAQIKDNFGQNGSYTFSFTYDSSWVWVTPDNFPKTKPWGTALADTFTVQNFRTTSITYTLTATCTNAASLSCSVPSSVTVGSNSSASVIVSYNTRAYNTVDTVTLRAATSDGLHYDTGKVIETASQYVTTASFGANNEDDQQLGLCANACFTTVVAHSTPSYRTLGANRFATLVYHGDRTAVRPYVVGDVTFAPGTSAPRHVRLTASVDDSLRPFVNGQDTLFFSTTGWQAGKSYRVAGQLDLSSLATKMHSLQITATAVYSDHVETFTSPASMKIMVVNLRTSTMLPTAGWTIAGVQQLYLQQDGTILIVEGDGSGVYFSCTSYSTPCAGPPGDYSKLSVSGSFFWRAYPDSSKVEFDNQGRMVEAIDRWGNLSVITYASSGPAYINTISDPLTSWFQFTYDTASKIIAIKSPKRGGGAPDGTSLQTTATYDSPGHHLTKFTDPDGDSTKFTYDASGRLTNVRDRLGDTTTYYYDANSWKLDSIAMPAVPIDGQPQPQSPVLRMRSWQRVGVPTTLTDTTTHLAAAPETDTIRALVIGAIRDTAKFTTDRWGQPLISIDPLGDTTTAVRSGINATSVTNPLGQTDTHSYNSNGLLTNSTPYGQPTTTISYDAWAMPSQVSGGNAPTITSSYSAVSHIITITVAGSFVGIDSLDARGRVFYSQDPAGHKTRYHYDAVFGNTDSTLSAAGQWTKVLMDGYGRDSAVMASAKHDTVRTVYDIFGRVSQVYDGVHAQPTQYSYNDLYLTTVRDPKGQVYKRNVNALGWSTVVYDPADTTSRKVTYKYDLAGRVSTWVNQRAQSATQQWDKLGRLTSRRDGTTADSLWYSSDLHTVVASNAISTDTMKLGNQGSDTVSTVIGGMWFRRVHSTTGGTSIDGSTTADTTFLSSSIGQLQNRMYFWSTSRGVLDSVKVGFPSLYKNYPLRYTNELLLDSLRYAAMGWRVDSLTTTHLIYARHHDLATADTAFGRGYTYDSLARITTESELSQTPGSTILRNYSFAPSGTVQQYKGTLISPQFSCSNGYGCSYTGATVQNTWRNYGFGYDAASNLTSQVDSLNGNALTQAFFQAGNRDTLWGTTRYKYDLDGNRDTVITGADTTTYTWSTSGRLLSVAHKTTTVHYGYNALGELVQRDSNGFVNRYFVWDNGQLLLTLDGNRNRIGEYAYLASGEPLSYSTGALTSPTTYYYQTDLRGDVIGLSDGSFVSQALNFDPWGALENQRGFGLDSTRLAWKGSMWEGGITNLYYVHNRWYDPSSRSFISQDPLGIDGGINTYSYAGNDPVNGADPDGLCTMGVNCLDQVYVGATGPHCGDPNALSALLIYDCDMTRKIYYAMTNEQYGMGQFRGRPSAGNAPAVPVEPEPLKEQAKRIGKKLLACTLDHYGLTGIAARAVSWTGMAPLSKAWLGVPVIEGASNYTNVISYLGLKTFPGLKIGRQILGTNRVFGLLGRANIVVGTALLAYDAISIGVCVAQD
jgi:RHS repeat-associated protein